MESVALPSIILDSRKAGKKDCPRREQSRSSVFRLVGINSQNLPAMRWRAQGEPLLIFFIEYSYPRYFYVPFVNNRYI